ncbi:GIP [Symbiodinium sp. CCMP2456]|nr:GIP [Symbiodinium sp. CCMP2456]
MKEPSAKELERWKAHVLSGHDEACVTGKNLLKYGLVGALRVPKVAVTAPSEIPGNPGIEELYGAVHPPGEAEEDEDFDYEPSIPGNQEEEEFPEFNFDEVFGHEGIYAVKEGSSDPPEGGPSGLDQTGSQGLQHSLESAPELPSDHEGLRAMVQDLAQPVEQVVFRYFVALRSKTGADVADALQRMVLEINKKFPVRVLHADLGTEFTSTALTRWLTEQNIRLQHTLPTDKKSNGLAERTVGWVKSRARWAVSSHNRSILGLPWIEARYAAPHLTISEGHVLVTDKGNLVASRGFKSELVDPHKLEGLDIPALQEEVEAVSDNLDLEDPSSPLPSRRLRRKTAVRFVECTSDLSADDFAAKLWVDKEYDSRPKTQAGPAVDWESEDVSVISEGPVKAVGWNENDSDLDSEAEEEPQPQDSPNLPTTESLEQDIQPDSVTQIIGWDSSNGEPHNYQPANLEEMEMARYLAERNAESYCGRLTFMGVQSPADLPFLYVEDLMEFGIPGEVRLFDRSQRQIPWVFQLPLGMDHMHLLAKSNQLYPHWNMHLLSHRPQGGEKPSGSADVPHCPVGQPESYAEEESEILAVDGTLDALNVVADPMRALESHRSQVPDHSEEAQGLESPLQVVHNVAPAEVRAHLEKWKSAALREAAVEGTQILPAKAVFTVKPGSAKDFYRRKAEKTRIMLRPPRILELLQITQPGELWYIERAIYGQRQSPRWWGDHRDSVLRQASWVGTRGVVKMSQSDVEGNLWTLVLETGETIGHAIVYVDDVMLLTSRAEAELAHAWIRSTWECTDLQTTTPEAAITFLGVEIQSEYNLEGNLLGFSLRQRGYIQELLRCYNIAPRAKQGVLPKDWVKDLPEEETYDENTLRMAQKITGELLWLTQRSRVDLAFAVSLMGSWTTRSPSFVYKMGIRLLQFLGSTLEHKLSLVPAPEAEKEQELVVEHCPGERQLADALTKILPGPRQGQNRLRLLMLILMIQMMECDSVEDEDEASIVCNGGTGLSSMRKFL